MTEVYQTSDGDWAFTMLFTLQGFGSKQDAEEGVERLKREIHTITQAKKVEP